MFRREKRATKDDLEFGTLSRHKRSSRFPEKAFWADLMHEMSEIDYGESIPDLDDEFVSIWSSHYARIAGMAKPRSPILEIGAGYGVLAAGLAQVSDGHVWATEHPSRKYLFQKGYLGFLRERKVQLIAQDLKEGLPFKSGTFQHVYCCDVIEHLLPQDILVLLEEIVRVLADEGEIILSTPNLNRLANWTRFVSGHSINPPLEVQKVGATLGHIRELAPKEIDTLLRRHGLRPVRHAFELNPYFTIESFGDYHAFSPSIGKFINRMTALASRLFPRVADEMYWVARKA